MMPRGRLQRTKDLWAACLEILEAIKPASVRAVCYQLFNLKLIDCMKVHCTKRISAHLTQARKEGVIPWAWIADETGGIEQPYGTWENPEEFMATVMRAYHRDRWAQQPSLVEVWSEKSTVRGTLAPVLYEYGVQVRYLGGWGGTTKVYEAAQFIAHAGKPVIILYVGDFDPSGMRMSEEDLPGRLAEYGRAPHRFERIALTATDGPDLGLASFPASDKVKDVNYPWFVARYGDTCWELDAMNPVDLRRRVAEHIERYIDWDAWERCQVTEEAEQRSMAAFFGTWKSIGGQVPL
jgi:hypothetical protein